MVISAHRLVIDVPKESPLEEVHYFCMILNTQELQLIRQIHERSVDWSTCRNMSGDEGKRGKQSRATTTATFYHLPDTSHLLSATKSMTAFDLLLFAFRRT